MWNYILNLWKSPTTRADDLSLEDASNILEEDLAKEEAEIKHLSENTNDDEIIRNTYYNKIGVITKYEEDIFFIDDQYSFTSDDANFGVGSRVSYNILIADGHQSVINVNLIDNDWDVVETNNSRWTTRVFICKVEQQINRTLILSPGDINVNLNDVALDFLPIVGDWVELDAKCSVDEREINLAGQIIQINRISPVRAHIESGIVTTWDAVSGTGVVNRNIGYFPQVRDKVIVEIVESDQLKCSWRALRLSPEDYSRELHKINTLHNLPEHIDEFKNEYPGLQIEAPLLNFHKLNKSESFKVIISNISSEKVILKGVEFFENNGQCKVINKFESAVEIATDTTFNVVCECTPKNIGNSSSCLLFYFENFKVRKLIHVNVSLHFEQPTNYLKGIPKKFYEHSSDNELVKGRRISAPPRFVSKDIPWYSVPKKLIDTISKYYLNDPLELVQELKVVKPVLFSNISFFNFEDKFHNLLYLEEIENLQMISNYDQEKACLIPCQDFLLLEIENLSERRPSIVLGDKVIATDAVNKNGVSFEGFVHKVGAKHIFLKFSQLFHDSYKGDDYSIKIVPSRSKYRRLHHAIFLAPRALGKEILFPSKIYEKDLQVNFFEAVDMCDNSIILNKTLSPQEAKKKLIEINNINKSAKNVNTPVGKCKLELEWYNKNLNTKQRDAVKNVLHGKARPLPYIIFGPPGTGKTVTIIEMVLQIIRLIPQSRLLITAPSNSASDLVALRLIESGVLKPGDLVRLVSYNYALSDTIPLKLVPYCATASLAKDGTADNETTTHSGVKLECSQAALGRHRITVSTCSLVGHLYSVGFPKGHFSHIIVDEAGQASEPEVLIPLTFLDKVSGQIILAGDPLQLGPVVLSKIAGECGLNESFLERLINRFPYVIDPQGFPDTSGYDPRLVTKLLYNYRSLPTLLKLTSSLFYNDELIATIDDKNSKEATFANKLGEMLPKNNPDEIRHLIFHGVDGENYQSFDSPSWYNPHEAAQVFYYVNELYRLGVASTEIGIITPYIKQVKEIRSLFIEAEFDIPKIGTVEEFQGQEFEVVILSTVRSCQEYVSVDVRHSLGFITSPRRLNVALSRAKALLFIIGNPNLLCQDVYWNSVLKYCLEHGSYTGCDLC
ncbi:hypothetical protein NQ315_000025 [Exocentrus adspersus]|uniref:RNA helicase n=1 Tax=Exocentrus adspersus TaxID=1586481 RepID=A0AAV8VFH1_9CUCU|nr:hypothetical protein NQ315_000025 [Exocentrus adspersus]